MLAVDTVAKVDWVAQYPILRDPYLLVTAPGFDLADLPTAPFVRYARRTPCLSPGFRGGLRYTPAPGRWGIYQQNLRLTCAIASLHV